MARKTIGPIGNERLGCRGLNQRLGGAARQRGAERNTWQDYGDRLLAEYERRLASRPAQTPG
jgi:hypothetical protein